MPIGILPEPWRPRKQARIKEEGEERPLNSVGDQKDAALGQGGLRIIQKK
jgi:hypothetical protein